MSARQGSVICFKPDRGFGFLMESDTRREYYFHICNVKDRVVLEPGDTVSFNLDTESPRTHARPQAIDVELLSALVEGGE